MASYKILKFLPLVFFPLLASASTSTYWTVEVGVSQGQVTNIGQVIPVEQDTTAASNASSQGSYKLNLLYNNKIVSSNSFEIPKDMSLDSINLDQTSALNPERFGTLLIYLKPAADLPPGDKTFTAQIQKDGATLKEQKIDLFDPSSSVAPPGTNCAGCPPPPELRAAYIRPHIGILILANLLFLFCLILLLIWRHYKGKSLKVVSWLLLVSGLIEIGLYVFILYYT